MLSTLFFVVDARYIRMSTIVDYVDTEQSRSHDVRYIRMSTIVDRITIII